MAFNKFRFIVFYFLNSTNRHRCFVQFIFDEGGILSLICSFNF